MKREKHMMMHKGEIEECINTRSYPLIPNSFSASFGFLGDSSLKDLLRALFILLLNLT